MNTKEEGRKMADERPLSALTLKMLYSHHMHRELHEVCFGCHQEPERLSTLIKQALIPGRGLYCK